MGAIYKIELDGYIFDYFIGQLEPIPTARIDEQGKITPMTIEEIAEWQDNYRRNHPELQRILQEIEEEKRISTIKMEEIQKKTDEKVAWWNSHPILKALCKPFLPSYYRMHGF